MVCKVIQLKKVLLACENHLHPAEISVIETWVFGKGLCNMG